MSFRAPAEIAKEIATVGTKKAKMSFSNTLILAIFAGFYLAFAGQLMIVVTHDGLANFGAGIMRFIGGSAFSLGLILIVLAGAELFTGNSLLTVGLLEKKFDLKALSRNWAIVYLGNFIGSILIVVLIYYSGLWQLASNAVGIKALNIAVSKVKLDFWTAMLRGIGANWLVCVAIWLAISGRSGIEKILGIYFPIMAFVVLGFEHSIANMFFIPMGLFLKGSLSVAGVSQLTVSSMFLNNLIPVTIGNIIGGVAFVAFPYWFVYLRNKKTPAQLTPKLVEKVVVQTK